MKSNNLNILTKYFPVTGTAESEANILDSAFVSSKDHLTIINPPYASPRLLVGRKGSGKSAFVRVFKNQLMQQKVPVLLLKPSDFDLTEYSKNDSISQMVRATKNVILLAVATKIGAELTGLLTDGIDQSLHELATKHGAKSKDWGRKIHETLAEVGKGVAKIDFSKITDNLQGIHSNQLKEAVTQNLGNNKKVFYVLLDDTDQVASPKSPGHLNRIWAFLLASRELLEENPDIRFIITLRREIWTRLMRDDAGQRDQVDHFRPLVYELNPEERDVQAILNRRLNLAKSELINLKSIGKLDTLVSDYAPFFDGAGITLPNSTTFTGWSDLIVKRSRSRPRDAIQFVALLCKEAIKLDLGKVSNQVVPKSLSQYSTERVDDLKREADSECPQIKEIIRSFHRLEYNAGSFKARADQIQNHLTKLPDSFGITLFGRTVHSNIRSEILDLWKYLFDIGFFGARSRNDEQPRGFEHTGVLEDSDLVSSERWNEMQKYIWEVNPAYRDFLIAQNSFKY